MCGKCGHQLYPMKGTIFERSTTPLTIWFQILNDFCRDHRGMSANFIHQKYNINYKAAFRICHRIRKGMLATLPDEPLSGTVGIDETFVGGKRKLTPKTDERGIGDKQMVFGIIEKKKKKSNKKNMVRLFYIERKNAPTIRPLIYNNIAEGSVIHHDNNPTYGNLKAAGYKPKLVLKKDSPSFLRGVHNNNIESMWSRVKSYQKATYYWASDKYLQRYLDEYCFRFYYRKDKFSPEFEDVIWRICLKE